MSLNKPQSKSLADQLRSSGLALSLVSSLALTSISCDEASRNGQNTANSSTPPEESKSKCPPQKRCPRPDATRIICDQLNTQVHSTLFQVSHNGKTITDLCDNNKEYPKCQFKAADEESNCSNCYGDICNIFVDNDKYVYPIQYKVEPQVATRLLLRNGTLAICLDPPKKYDTSITNRRRFSTTHTDSDAGISTSAGVEHSDRNLADDQIKNLMNKDRLTR